MSFHLINMIARYEMRTLLRSWFFRIFALLAIVGLGIFNVAMNIESSGAPWIYKALSASIPYANLIILNLGQAIVAVFLASEFLKQDKKNDTVEVIYARSMSNGQYMLGKTLGILAVFLVLNLIVLAMGIGFSFMSGTGSRNILSYFMYPLLISLPTLVFILGLSFFVMVLIKNQAVTFIILLGYIALTIFYLNQKLYHILDYIAYNIPMMYSNISGFASFSEILYHRLIYFLLGVGFIFLAVYRLPRLPQPHNRAFVSLIVGVVFIFAGGFFAYKYLDQKYSVIRFRQQALALNNLYSNYPMASVKSCNINLEHTGNRIAAKVDLVVTNENEEAIDTLILSLNPSLDVKTITINHKSIAFTRRMHLVFLKLPSFLKQGDDAALNIAYDGEIDERICFLDQTDENATFIFNLEVFTFQKRYAFLDDNYVCLTSESMWYPSAWTGYATARPFYYAKDMINFGLHVKTNSALTAISQGKSVMTQKGMFTFTPEHPMPKISLIIGDYEKRSIKVDSVEYQVYAIKGHGYLAESFKNFTDTIPKLIKDLKNDFETQLGMRYPYKRFSLTEVPVHFCLDKHEYTYTSDAVQPEMILSPEMGVMFSSSNFGFMRYRIERDMKRNNEEALPEEISARLFRQFIQSNFTSFSYQNYPGRMQDENTFSAFPLFYSYVTPLEPRRWPVLSLAFDAYYHRRNVAWAQRYGFSSLDDISQRMDTVSLKESLAKDVVLAKGYDLFSLLKAKYGKKEVDSLFSELLVSNAFKKVRFEDVSSLFRKKLNANIDSIVGTWYSQSLLPSFNISSISSYKVVKGEEVSYQVRFFISNTGQSDGVATVNIEETNPNRKNDGWWDDNFNADFSRSLYIPAQSSFEAGFVFAVQPRRMSIETNISKNLPNNIAYDFPGFDEIRNVPVFNEVRNVPFMDSRQIEGEYIVDNEDKGFSIQQVTNQAFLKSLIKKKNEGSKYTYVRYWDPDREWKAVLNSDFYGQNIRSAYYTSAGNGERKATWKTKLPVGSYEVYFYINKINFGWRRNRQASDYNMVVYHDGGQEKINQPTENVDKGWSYLGTFTFSDTARVELSNKSKGDMIFADAVKWVKVK